MPPGACPAARSIRFSRNWAKDSRINIVAINYKDQTENALRFLGRLVIRLGHIGIDPKGTAAIDWGVYGIPESYLVAPDGTILYKRVGPVTPQNFDLVLKAEIEKALNAGS